MKNLGGVFLVGLCLLATTHSYPRRDWDSNEDTSVEMTDHLKGVDCDNPESSNPFSWHLQQVQDLMRKWKESMTNSLFSGLPKLGFIPWETVLEGANTTSTTTVINGHVVTINETTYENSDKDTVIRVRIFDVVPASSENETTVEPLT